MTVEDDLVAALHARADAVPHSPMPPLGTPRAQRKWLMPVAAAAAAILVAAAAVFMFRPDDGAAPVATAPPDGVPAAGEVYYSLRLTDIGAGNVIRETQLWQPAEREGAWSQHIAMGLKIQDGRVVPGGVGEVGFRPGGVCYPGFEASDDACTTGPSWFSLTIEFLATASRDPAIIGQELATGTDDHTAYLAELHMIGELLAGNGVPPELSRALRQVIAAMPGIEVTEGMANLLGERGTGYSYPHPKNGKVAVIFDADGQYLGSPKESVHHGIAPGLGKPPSRMLG
jgi:hypothetical protein